MASPEDQARALAPRLRGAPQKGRRKLIALVGPPGAGKSTLAAALCAQMSAQGIATAVVPMDGFHLDNQLLDRFSLRARKGAPQTFDADGVVRLVGALAEAERVFYPLFDRAEDLARAGAGMVGGDCACVIVEGNYLLLDQPGWRDLQPFWDFTIRLDVPLEVLRARLVQRWLDHGLDRGSAEARAEGNDLENARLIAAQSLAADITV